MENIKELKLMLYLYLPFKILVLIHSTVYVLDIYNQNGSSLIFVLYFLLIISLYLDACVFRFINKDVQEYCNRTKWFIEGTELDIRNYCDGKTDKNYLLDITIKRSEVMKKYQ